MIRLTSSSARDDDTPDPRTGKLGWVTHCHRPAIRWRAFFCAGGDQGLDYWILSKMRVFLFDPPPFVLDLF